MADCEAYKSKRESETKQNKRKLTRMVVGGHNSEGGIAAEVGDIPEDHSSLVGYTTT